MAAFGAQFPCFAPFNSVETDTAPPTYAEGVVIGKLVSANMTVTMATGEIYGDDIKVEQMNEFASGAIPMETVDIEDDVAAVVYGATPVDGSIVYKSSDEAPYGGLGYFKSVQRNGLKFYKAYFYPKVQAAVGNDNAQTKGSSITFQTTITNFTILPPYYDDAGWMVQETFKTIAEAKTWIRQKLNMEATTPTVTGAEITGTAEVGQALGVSVSYSSTPSTAPTLVYQWQISDDDTEYTDISGATSETYTVLAADATKYIKCVVTASGSATGTATTPTVQVL